MKRLLQTFFVASLVAGLPACLSTPPPHPRALEANELCSRYISQGDLTTAEVQCDLGLQFSPQYADLWVNKGLIAYNRGQNDKAKEYYIKALRYNQEQAQAYNNLGVIYMLQEHAYGKAHDNFQRALKVNPDYTEARYNLALCFNYMGDKSKAKKELRTIIAINPQIADPHATLGSILHEESADEEAVAELRAAVQLDPTFDSAWLELGNTLMDSGNAPMAVDAYSSCIEASRQRAITLCKQTVTTEAELNDCVPLHENIECKNNIAVAQRKANLQDTALKEAKEEASGEKTPEAYWRAATAYKEKGMVAEEERFYRRCLKLDPKFALCHWGLYEIFQAASKTRDATIACKNFLKFAESGDYKDKVETCERYVSANTY